MHPEVDLISAAVRYPEVNKSLVVSRRKPSSRVVGGAHADFLCIVWWKVSLEHSATLLWNACGTPVGDAILGN